MVMERYMDAEARFLHAQILIERGEFVEAKAVLEEILQDEPDYGRAHNHLGWIYHRKYINLNRAEYHLRLAVKFAPDYPGGYINYASVLTEIEKFELVEQVATKALEVKGINKAYVLYFLALAKEMTAGPKEGIKHLRIAKNAASDMEMSNLIKREIKRVKKKMNTLGKIAVMFL